jgi:hypothetical protein
MLGVSIGLNALSTHGTCTAVFVAVAAIIGFLFASVRTLGRLGWLAWVGSGCVIVSVFVLTVAAGVQDRPSEAPQTGPWASDFKIVGNPTFEQAMAAISSLVLSYAGVPAFFAVASEMSDFRLYSRSVITCQSVATVTYTVVGIVVYYYCGSYVASPALGSAGVLMKKVCYGLILPGLIVSTLLYIHVSSDRNTSLRIGTSPSTNTQVVDGQILHGAHSSRLQTPRRQHMATLDDLAMLHRRYYHHRILHRQWHPGLSKSGLARRSAIRNFHDVPADGGDVVLRQLEQGRPRLEVEVRRLLGVFRDRCGNVPDDWRNLRLCGGHHRLLQRGGRVLGLVVC